MVIGFDYNFNTDEYIQVKEKAIIDFCNYSKENGYEFMINEEEYEVVDSMDGRCVHKDVILDMKKTI